MTTWTPDLTKEVIALRQLGLSTLAISKAVGLTRNQVTGKLNRLGVIGNKPKWRPPETRQRRKLTDRPAPADWEIKLFEPYYIYKERKRRERARDAARLDH